MIRKIPAFLLGLALACSAGAWAEVLAPGLGSMAYQSAASVAITGGTISGFQGATGTPSIKGTDTDSGIWFTGNNTRFSVDGATAGAFTGGSPAAQFRLNSASGIGWASSTDAGGTLDTGVSRSSAGVLEANNGTTGTLRPMNASAYQINSVTQKFPKTFTATYNPAAVAVLTERCDNVTVTGITTSGGAVSENPGGDPVTAGCVMESIRASAADTARICWFNPIAVTTQCQPYNGTHTFTQAQ